MAMEDDLEDQEQERRLLRGVEDTDKSDLRCLVSLIVLWSPIIVTQ